MPVVAYHAIGAPKEFRTLPRFDPGGLNIPVRVFRDQLAAMYDDGYRPVNLRDAIRKHLNLPAGARPIVLTFDDGRATQFRFLANGRLDPNCAVGVLADFHHRHPDWAMRGTFYLIAGSDDNGVPFDQEGQEAHKARMLLRWGFEIGNHTLTHPNFRPLKAGQIVRELAGCDAYLKRLVPGVEVDTLAMPYGILPADPKLLPLLRHGLPHGEGYRNIGIVLFDNRLSPSPYSRDFDPFRIHRLIPKPGRLEAFLAAQARKRAT